MTVTGIRRQGFLSAVGCQLSFGHLFFALAMMTALLPGCTWDKIIGARGDRKVAVIEFWHSMTGDKSLVLNTIVEEYNVRARSGGFLPVQLQFTGTYADGINKLRLAVMAKRPPHLAQIYEIGTRQLVDSGAVVPLEELIDGDESFGLAQMLPQVLDYYRVHGTVYSLPFATSNPVIYANADVLSAAGYSSLPETFEQIKAVCPRLVDQIRGRTCMTMPLTSWLFEQAVARQGAHLLDQDNGRSAPASRALFHETAGRHFLDILGSLTRDGYFANTGRAWDPPVENFMAGRSALLVTSTSDVFVLEQKAKFTLLVGRFPGFTAADAVTGQNNDGGTVIGGNSIWAMKGHPRAEMVQAARFLKYLASAEVQKKWHVRTGYFPIRGDVIDQLEADGFYRKNPNARVAIDQLLAAPLTVAARGALSGVFPEMREHIENAMEEVLAGKSDPEVALGRASGKSDKALMRYKKLL